MTQLNWRIPQSLAVKVDSKVLLLPPSFKDFNSTIGNPTHPETGDKNVMFDFQVDYFKAVQQYHKVILNKSRKIGATETALRIILYNILMGHYANHSVMIVAGNRQSIANKFIKRMRNILREGFVDLNGIPWYTESLITSDTSSYLEFFNGCEVEAFPAADAVRGIENTICIFMSEAAFIDLIDDREVYNAVKPNIANITNADFILESTPNGRRGFYYEEYRSAQKNLNEFKWLEQPYTVAVGGLLSRQFIDNERKNPKIDFEQEYMCKFTTSQSAAFSEQTIKYGTDSDDFTVY